MYITTVCACTQDYCKYKMKPLRYDAIPSRPLPASPPGSIGYDESVSALCTRPLIIFDPRAGAWSTAVSPEP
jgi:hypothetical protein